MKTLQRGAVPARYFGISFAEVGAMFAAFTPRRWELIAALRESGPLTVAELARRLKRNYKNVHTDVNQLIEWMAVERDEKGLVGVPWSGILVDMKLPQRQVAQRGAARRNKEMGVHCASWDRSLARRNGRMIS